MARKGNSARRAAALNATQSIKIDGGQSTEIGGTQTVVIDKGTGSGLAPGVAPSRWPSEAMRHLKSAAVSRCRRPR